MSQLHAPLIGNLSSSVPDESVTSSVYLRALFCMVASPEFTLYTLFTELYIGTGMKMSRYIRSTFKNKLFYQISPIFIPTSNHNLPGRRLGRHHTTVVDWSYLPIITWSLLPPNSSSVEPSTNSHLTMNNIGNAMSLNNNEQYWQTALFSLEIEIISHLTSCF